MDEGSYIPPVLHGNEEIACASWFPIYCYQVGTSVGTFSYTKRSRVWNVQQLRDKNTRVIIILHEHTNQ